MLRWIVAGSDDDVSAFQPPLPNWIRPFADTGEGVRGSAGRGHAQSRVSILGGVTSLGSLAAGALLVSPFVFSLAVFVAGLTSLVLGDDRAHLAARYALRWSTPRRAPGIAPPPTPFGAPRRAR